MDALIPRRGINGEISLQNKGGVPVVIFPAHRPVHECVEAVVRGSLSALRTEMWRGMPVTSGYALRYSQRSWESFTYGGRYNL